MFVDSLARRPRHHSVDECGSPRQGAPARPKVDRPTCDPSRPYAMSDPRRPSCDGGTRMDHSLHRLRALVAFPFGILHTSLHSSRAHNSILSFSVPCTVLVLSSAPERNSTPVLSGSCTLFRKNTGGTLQSSCRLFDSQFSSLFRGLRHGGSTTAHLRQFRLCQANRPQPASRPVTT